MREVIGNQKSAVFILRFMIRRTINRRTIEFRFASQRYGVGFVTFNSSLALLCFESDGVFCEHWA